jgi:quercetin dioxygenase-like cupin family protein
MRRIAPGALLIGVLGVLPVLAQPHGHTVAMPDTLTWVEPPVLPGARLALVQGDPSKERLFVYRIKMPAHYRSPPHTHKASENVTVLAGLTFVNPADDPRKKP